MLLCLAPAHLSNETDSSPDDETSIQPPTASGRVFKSGPQQLLNLRCLARQVAKHPASTAPIVMMISRGFEGQAVLDAGMMMKLCFGIEGVNESRFVGRVVGKLCCERDWGNLNTFTASQTVDKRC